MTEWFDDPAFWEAMAPALCAPERLAFADREVAAILSHVPLPEGASILDLGCGPGAHAISLARRGHHVTGVDASSPFLERARRAARTGGVDAEWVSADMREYRRPGAFDLALSLNMSFGWFDDRGNRRVLENVRESLTDGGTFLLDVVGREAAEAHWKERRQVDVGGATYLERCRHAEDWSWIESDWVVVRGGRRQEFRARMRFFSGPELRDLLLGAGFATVRLSGALDGTVPYDAGARRLVAVAGRSTGNGQRVSER